MEIGLGMLGLAPDVFWGMTLREFAAAIRGYQTRMGKRPAQAAAALDKDSAEKQVKAFFAHLKQKQQARGFA